jgi:hypothetical protein
VQPPGRTRAQRELRDAVGQAVHDHLRAACRFAAWDENEERKGPSVGRQFTEWWTGASCEGAYLNLHEAEIALVQLLPDDEIQAGIPEALARLQTMDVTDPRRRAAETQLAGHLPRAQRRAAFQSAVRTGLELIDRQHARLRAFRNIVLTTTAGLMLLVVAMCVVVPGGRTRSPSASARNRPPSVSPRCRSRVRSGWHARQRRRRRPPGTNLAGSPLPATSRWCRSLA